MLFSSEPTAPVHLIATVVDDGSVKVSWQPPLSTHGPLVNYILMYTEFKADRTTGPWKLIRLEGK